MINFITYYLFKRKIIELQSDYTEENQIIDRLVSYPTIETL